MVKEHLLDKFRKRRIGIDETIFCKDKNFKQITSITSELNKNKTTLFTKLKPEIYDRIETKFKKYFFMIRPLRWLCTEKNQLLEKFLK